MTTELTTRVLGMRTSDCFAAVALDIDVWGYGESRSEALLNLQEHINMHVKYLVRAKKAELFHRPTLEQYYSMYQLCIVARIRNKEMTDCWVDQLAIPELPSDRYKTPDQNLKRIKQVHSMIE